MRDSWIQTTVSKKLGIEIIYPENDPENAVEHPFISDGVNSNEVQPRPARTFISFYW